MAKNTSNNTIGSTQANDSEPSHNRLTPPKRELETRQKSREQLPDTIIIYEDNLKKEAKGEIQNNN